MALLRFAGWLLTNAVALAVAAALFDGIGFGAHHGDAPTSDKIGPLVFVALILGVVNAFVAPVLKVLSIPFIIVTLGLFLLVINALMLLFTEWLAGLFGIDFFVDGFWTAVFGSIVITVVTWLVRLVIGEPGEE